MENDMKEFVAAYKTKEFQLYFIDTIEYLNDNGVVLANTEQNDNTYGFVDDGAPYPYTKYTLEFHDKFNEWKWRLFTVTPGKDISIINADRRLDHTYKLIRLKTIDPYEILDIIVDKVLSAKL